MLLLPFRRGITTTAVLMIAADAGVRTREKRTAAVWLLPHDCCALLQIVVAVMMETGGIEKVKCCGAVVVGVVGEVLPAVAVY